jgi:splicing factor 3B subunit 3
MFNPRSLKNFVSIDELESLAPIVDFKVADLAKEQDSNQIYALSGTGASSALKILK